MEVPWLAPVHHDSIDDNLAMTSLQEEMHVRAFLDACTVSGLHSIFSSCCNPFMCNPTVIIIVSESDAECMKGAWAHLPEEIPDDCMEGLHGCIALAHLLWPHPSSQVVPRQANARTVHAQVTEAHMSRL